MGASIEEVDLAGRIMVLVLCVAMASCTTTSVPDYSSTTQPPDTASSTSTTTSAATTTSTTTTTPVPEVTSDPFVPAATSAAATPWSDVGPGWHVALYDSDKAAPTGPGDVREGPTVLYLVAPDGALYEAFSWPGGVYPTWILDARPDGTAALVAVSTGPDTVEITQVDMQTQTATTVLERGWPEVSYGNFPAVMTFTRPTGTNHVVYESDGITERLLRRSGGSTVATLYEQDYVEGPDHLTWLYHHDGTAAVIGHNAGIAMVSNTGVLEADLWVPPDRTCDPVRWWDVDTLLATCRGGPAVAPHEFYHQLWFIETDGTAGSPLTAVPSDAFVGDFGFVDAWFRSAGELVQWTGDCGAAHVRWWDGVEGVPYGVSFPGADGYQMLGIYDVAMGIHAWQGCGQDVGFLYSVNTEDLAPTMLLGPVGDARGVIAAVALVDLFD